MCLGIPGQIIAISDPDSMMATIDVCGIKRQVSVACVADEAIEDLIGKWALVHVGFAMSLLDEDEAMQTLEALKSMQALEHEVDDFTGLGVDSGEEQ